MSYPWDGLSAARVAMNRLFVRLYYVVRPQALPIFSGVDLDMFLELTVMNSISQVIR
jgi:hypothetical protein